MRHAMPFTSTCLPPASLPTSRCLMFANCPGLRNRLKLVLLDLAILAGALP